MLHTLYGRLVIVLVGFALIMSVALVLVMRHSDNARRLEITQRAYRPFAAQLVTSHILPAGKVELSAFGEVFDRLKVINPRIDAYLIDDGGTVLASSSKGGTLRRAVVDMRPIREILGDNPTLPVLGDDPVDERAQRVFSVAPLKLHGRGDAYLYLVIKGIRTEDAVQHILESYTLRENVTLIGGALLAALAVSALIVGFLTRRLRRLANVMDRFRGSDFAEPPTRNAPRRAGDEIDRLAATFEEMAERILGQMSQLKRTDTMRRELVANISHDLRTPLASLQGHLETLRFKGGLSEEEKRGYLEIALRQSEQLSRLVSQLFDLAKLDSEQADIQAEPFVLEDLVQDLVQEFRLPASERQVALATDQPAEPSLVMADIGLIERVLRNLIENSLRYTPAGGEIRIAIEPAGGHVAVRVSDTGCGISAEDLPRIFDRCYRGEKSRSDSAGAGLGLAIARRILELHGSEVTATSRPGATTIGFTLPRAETQTIDADEPAPRPVPAVSAGATAAPLTALPQRAG
jgi:signal transduction histidine kinase